MSSKILYRLGGPGGSTYAIFTTEKAAKNFIVTNGVEYWKLFMFRDNDRYHENEIFIDGNF